MQARDFVSRNAFEPTSVQLEKLTERLTEWMKEDGIDREDIISIETIHNDKMLIRVWYCK